MSIYLASLKTENDNTFITNLRIEDNGYVLKEDDVILTKVQYAMISSFDIEKNELKILTDIEENETTKSKIVKAFDVLDIEDNVIEYPIYLAVFQERTGSKFITGTAKHMSNEYYNPEMYVVISYEVYEALQSYNDSMRLGYVFVPIDAQAIVDTDELKIEITESTTQEVKTENLTSSKMTVDSYRKAVQLKARDLMFSRFDGSVIFSFYEFILLNNQLIEQGFVITEENREDKYIEIVNKDNDELLELLSDYLKARDSLKMYNLYYKDYKALLNDIQKLNEVPAIEERFNSFRDQFK